MFWLNLINGINNGRVALGITEHNISAVKSVVLKDSTYKTLLEITRLFDIDLNKYKYPMTNIKWNNFYKME